ncbi:MAG: hypothetical protein WC457_04440 [Patescibacteria group bacterium]
MTPRKVATLIILVLILFVGAFYFTCQKPKPKNIPVACTEEAKICDDGTTVWRVGPNCDFSACPSSNDGENWITSTTAQGIKFQYPEKFSTTYMHPPYFDTESWPPKISVSDKQFSCAETPAESSLPNRVAQKNINQSTYCISAESEGAAGSTYTKYIYTTIKNGKLVSASFTVQAVQCLNYDEPEQSACVEERETFDLDAVAEKIVESVKI